MEKSKLFSESKRIADLVISVINSKLFNFGISQKEFAEIAHIDTGNLSKILSGVIYPNFKTLCRLVVALDSFLDDTYALRLRLHLILDERSRSYEDKVFFIEPECE